jgi:hypothetical protein
MFSVLFFYNCKYLFLQRFNTLDNYVLFLIDFALKKKLLD